MDVIGSIRLRLTPKTRLKRKKIRRDTFEAELHPEGKQRWNKGQSFRRRLNRRALSPPPVAAAVSRTPAGQHSASSSDTSQLTKAYGNVLDAAEQGSQTDGASVQSEPAAVPAPAGRAASWAQSFERLLEDPAGLHTFAEFLKSQFSHENIYFWVACERYKQLPAAEARRLQAQRLYERHLCVGAPEPVNVDSAAQQAAQDGVEQAAVGLFDKAQQQIFSLMKYDCYPRFLKAAIYTDCVSREAAGQPLPYPGGETLESDLRLQPDPREQKQQSKKASGKPELGGEQRRRKSLLPWHRKDRSKSKDRGEAEYKRKKRQRERDETGSVRSDLSGSRTSLASADLAAMQRGTLSKESLASGDCAAPAAAPAGSITASSSSSNTCGAPAADCCSDAAECLLCRVLLPDASSAVVQAAPDVSVRLMLQRLLERRALPYNSWDVYLAGSERPLDQAMDSCRLGCKEIRMEQRVLFRVDLPNQKTIGVKAKPNRLAGEVLKPILSKYGFKLDSVLVFESGSGGPVDLKWPVTRLDNSHLAVRRREESRPPAELRRAPPSLDEVTNRVFEDLLNGKADGTFDDFGVIDLDQNSNKTDGSCSDQSASLLASLVRRNSLTSGRTERRAHRHQAAGGDHPPPPPPPPPPRLADGKETDVALYEGLKRAQMCRLDDQRGTEINFELPEFLKRREAVQNKENFQPERLSEQVALRRRGPLPAGEQRHSLASRCSADAALHGAASWRCRPLLAGILPTDRQAEQYFQAELDGSGRLSLGLGDAGRLLCPPMPRLTPRRPDAAAADTTPPPPAPPEPLTTSLHLDEADFSPPPPPPPPLVEPAPVAAALRPRLTAAGQTPPPPLPPKPKLLVRGPPPPRPPARPAAAEDVAAAAAAIGRSRKAIYLEKADKLNISFV